MPSTVQHRDPIERFIERIEFTDTCWNWTGHLDTNGYGQIRVAGKKPMVHAFGWNTFVGPIEPGLELDHLCRNRRCVNPDHLEPVTRQVNLQRAAAANVLTACRHGHPFTAENTRITPDGHRRCQTCARLRREAIKAGVEPPALWKRPRPLATHCKRGHELSGDNLLVSSNQRFCRTCMRERRSAARSA
jgi:hypothetical protein